MEQTKFINLINQLSIIADRDGWQPSYDKNLDYFYWMRQPLDSNTKLVKVSHETSLYLNAKGKIVGAFVEYLNGNFIEHNPTYKDFAKQFTKKIDETTYTVGDKKKAQKYLFAFGEALRADIYQDAIENKKLDFNKLVKYALSNK